MQQLISFGSFVKNFRVHLRHVGLLTALFTTSLLHSVCPAAVLVNTTGVGLLSDSRVTFPNGLPTVDGSSIVFGSPGPNYAKLFQVSLGSFSYNDVFDVKIDLTRKTVDWDPRILLADGNQMYGGAITDDNGGSYYPTRFYESTLSGNYDGSDAGINNGGFPDVDGSIFIHLRYSFSPTSSTVTILQGFNQVPFTFSTPSAYINPTNGLSFAMLRDNEPVEIYQINSLQITAVPEPGIMLGVILMAVLCGIWFIRKRIAGPPKIPRDVRGF
jgi:hypothetical protein